MGQSQARSRGNSLISKIMLKCQTNSCTQNNVLTRKNKTLKKIQIKQGELQYEKK